MKAKTREYIKDIIAYRKWKTTEKAIFVRSIVSVNPKKYRIVVK